MSQMIDIQITDDDLAFGPGDIAYVEGEYSIAQDIKHMIRESGLLVAVIGERDPSRRQTAYHQVEQLMEEDKRLVPGTAQVTELEPGTVAITAEVTHG